MAEKIDSEVKAVGSYQSSCFTQTSLAPRNEKFQDSTETLERNYIDLFSYPNIDLVGRRQESCFHLVLKDSKRLDRINFT